MNWDKWISLWRAHSTTEHYRMRVRTAAGIAQDAIESGRRLYAGISGGKDSIALGWIVKLAGGSDVQFAHAHTPLETPGMLDCAELCAEQLGKEIDIIEPDCEGVDFWEWFSKWNYGENPFSEPRANELRLLISAGNMLEQYAESQKYHGAFTGMRAEESRGRRLNRRMRGTTYEVKYMPGFLMCNPLSDWTSRDVYAALVSNELPICAHYRLALERMGISPEQQNSRVDMVVPPEKATTLPTLHIVSRLYPDLFRKLCECRPELRRELL